MSNPFSPEEKITGEQAHRLAKEFAARAWPDNEVLITTHLDAAHFHTHFIVNSVCYGTGRMLRQGPGTLHALRQMSDELCMKYGFSVLPREQGKKRTHGMDGREYRSAAKGESWKFRLIDTIDQCMRYASDKEEFIALSRVMDMGFVDGQPEEHYLHHASGNEVQRRPAPQ